MVRTFEASQNQNVKACAFSIFLLNYNSAITSYIMYLRKAENVGRDVYVFAVLSLLLGLFFGQIVFGIFGDAFGRRKSFWGSCSLMLVGGVLSALVSDQPIFGVSSAVQFGIFRFFMGIGAGGLYPIVAAMTRESSQTDLANSHIAYIYGPIGSLGLALAPFGVFLLSYTSIDAVWTQRLLLLAGALPIACLYAFNVQETYHDAFYNNNNNNSPLVGGLNSDHQVVEADADESGEKKAKLPQQQQQQQQVRQLEKEWTKQQMGENQGGPKEDGSDSICSSIRLFQVEMAQGFSASPSFVPFLIGTSLSWFLSDLVHYGNVLYQVQLLNDFTSSDSWDDDDFNFTLSSLAIFGVLTSMFFWLGGICSVMILRHLSAVALQLHGFILSAAAYFLSGIAKAFLPPRYWPVCIGFYCMTYLFNGMTGPTTFMLPSLLFAQNVRSTANGLSAAIGKLGAIVAVCMIGYTDIYISVLMALFAGVSIAGVATTLFLVRSQLKTRAHVYSAHRAYHDLDTSADSCDSANSSSYHKGAIIPKSNSFGSDDSRHRPPMSFFGKGDDFSADFDDDLSDEERTLERLEEEHRNRTNQGSSSAAIIADGDDDIDDAQQAEDYEEFLRRD